MATREIVKIDTQTVIRMAADGMSYRQITAALGLTKLFIRGVQKAPSESVRAARICDICGEAFSVRGGRQMRCSWPKKCSVIAKRVHARDSAKTKTCAVCFSIFTPLTGATKHCSPACVSKSRSTYVSQYRKRLRARPEYREKERKRNAQLRARMNLTRLLLSASQTMQEMIHGLDPQQSSAKPNR